MRLIKRFSLNKYKEIPFFFSIWYTIILSTFVYIFWLFDFSIYGITALLVLLGVILALCKDLTPLVPFAFILPQIISDGTQAIEAVYYYIGGASFIVIGLIIHFIRFRPFHNYGKIKGFAVAVCFVGLAIALGGICVKDRSVLPALIVVGYGILSCCTVFFLIATLGKDSPSRLSKATIYAIIASSAIAFLQLLTLIIKSGDPINAISSKYSLNAGYAHPNYLANLISRCIPIAIFLSTGKHKKSFLWLIVAYIAFLGVLVTSSRATILFSIIIAVICVIYFFPKLETKSPWVCLLAMLLGITLILIGALGDRIENLFATMSNNGFDSNGRFELWKIGLDRFKKHPFFGVGLDYDLGGRTKLNPTNQFYTPYWYHNTFIQMLCCFGIFGFIAFIPYFFHQYRTMILAKTPSVTALIFVLLLIQAISLLDVFFFTPQEYLQMIIITIAGIKNLPEDKGNSYFYNIIKFIKNKNNKKKEAI